MAKLSYVARKTTGIKIATACQKDIKRKIQADAKEVAKNPSKERDSHLELFLTGRLIGDEGIKLVCEALYEAITTNVLKLEGLHISDNEITPAGLLHLGMVIRAAAKQLRDLDLSNNKIGATNKKETVLLERFWIDIGEVRQLIRLDLSGNPLGNARSMEVLLRCYSRELPLEMDLCPIVLQGELEIPQPNSDEEGEPAHLLIGKKPKRRARRSGNKEDIVPIPTGITVIGVDPSTNAKGLRSIPFIVLKNTNLDDGGSFFFSYIVFKHFPPKILMSRFVDFKAGTHLAGVLQELVNESQPGLVYYPNDRLSDKGRGLLEEAERLRLSRKEFIHSEIESDSEFELEVVKNTRRRGSSLTGIRTQTAEGIERFRSKVMGDLLSTSDLQGVELWKIAIDMLLVVRELLPTRYEVPEDKLSATMTVFNENKRLSPVAKKKQEKKYDNEFPVILTNNANGASAPTPANKPANKPKPVTLRLVNRPASKMTIGQRPKPPAVASVAPVPLQVRNPDTVTVPVTRAATTPDHTVPMKPKPPASTPIKLTLEEAKVDRTRLLGNLPVSIWMEIIRLAVDPAGVTSRSQQENIMDYGLSKETLKIGREHRGKLQQVQIWDFLHRVNCLTYDI